MHPTRRSRSSVSADPAAGQAFGSLPLLVDTRIFRSRPRPGVVWAALLMGLAALLVASTPAGAQSNDSLIAERQFMGAAQRDGVVVRSGPSAGHLNVTTLPKDEQVVVVGVNGDFLQILPPQGTFCLVPRARVNVRGEAGGEKIGRVTEACSVKAGSRINNMPGETTARLPEGAEVVVIGEDSTYYHVVPPKEVFFYVQKSELARVREVRVTETARGWSVGDLPPAGGLADAGANTGEAAAQPQGQPEGPVAQGDAQQPQQPQQPGAAESAETPPVVTQIPEIPEVVLPTTRPAVYVEFEELDKRYSAVGNDPVEEQPLEELKQAFQALLAKAKEEGRVGGLVPAIEMRLRTIEVRQEALQDLRAVQAMREEMDKRQKMLEAESQELAERVENSKVTVYTAVGVLQPSTLQVGSTPIFRLCDPGNGRTIIYLRAEGEQAQSLARHLEKFIGVRGAKTDDKDLSMTFIQVNHVAGVDPAEVFKSVAAELIPPSMVQNAGVSD